MWALGTQLPTRDHLAAKMSTSPATIQMAIHALVKEGSVVTRKRASTFIADHPPELGRLVLAIIGRIGFKFLKCKTRFRPISFFDC